MGRRVANSNLSDDSVRPHGGESAMRATMASLYAAAEAAPVDARNAQVLVRLGGDTSASSSSESETSEPSREPSPPKSVPRAQQKAFAKSFVGQQRPAHKVRFEETPRAREARGSTRFGFSPASSAATLSSSLSAMDGTASLGSSASSFQANGSAAAGISDGGKLSVAHLTTCDESCEGKEAQERESELPPKLKFTLKPVTAASATATEAKVPFPGENASASGNASTLFGGLESNSTPRFALDATSSLSFVQSTTPRDAGRIVGNPRRASLPGGTAAVTQPARSTSSQFSSNASRSFTATSSTPATFLFGSNVGDNSAPSAPTSFFTLGSSSLSHATSGVSQEASKQPQAMKDKPTNLSMNSVPSSKNPGFHEENDALPVHAREDPASSSASFDVDYTASGCRDYLSGPRSFSSSAINEPRSPSVSSSQFSSGGVFVSPRTPRFFSAHTMLSPIALEISEASLIACGKTGRVYKAVSGVSRLAVKVVSKPLGKAANSRFEKELIALQNLPSHRGLVRHHGYMSLVNDDKVGVITDMVVGSHSLQDRLHCEFSTLEEKAKLHALLEISEALAFLHSHGITHRDLSLNHVLYSFGSESGTVKLIDFGLPTLRGSKSSNIEFSSTGWIGVTPEYASPEVLRGNISCHDHDGWMKSDVFSFTVLMVELLLGELPWEGESLMYIVNAVSKRGERPFCIDRLRLFGTRSSELESIIRDAWHDDPSRRPSSNELHMKLESLFAPFLSGEKPEKNLDPFDSAANLFHVQNIGEECRGTTAVTFPFTSLKSASVPAAMGADNSGMPTASTQASHKPEQTHSLNSGKDGVCGSSVARFSFGLSAPAQSSTLSPGTTRFSFSSTSVYEPASSARNSSVHLMGSPPSAFTKLPSSEFKFPSSTPISSLAGLTVAISDKTHVTMGNRGSVYRGFHRDGQVAVEVVNKPKSKSARFRLDKEIVALKNLPDHPHLVRHYGTTQLGDNNQCGIITDLVFDDRSIDDRLHRGACPIEEADKHRMLIQIIDAVAYLHAHGITHRDLTLKYVLNTYSTPPAIKLVNYGLPTLRGATTSTSASRTDTLIASTLEYASPEVLSGVLSTREVDDWDKSNGGWATRSNCSTEGKCGWRESDVYSFAVLLVELLLEEKPWDGELPTFVVNAVTKHGRRPFKAEDVRVFGKRSPALEALIQEAWHHDPAKRPTAHNLKTRLETIFHAK